MRIGPSHPSVVKLDLAAVGHVGVKVVVADPAFARTRVVANSSRSTDGRVDRRGPLAGCLVRPPTLVATGPGTLPAASSAANHGRYAGHGRVRQVRVEAAKADETWRIAGRHHALARRRRQHRIHPGRNKAGRELGAWWEARRRLGWRRSADDGQLVVDRGRRARRRLDVQRVKHKAVEKASRVERLEQLGVLVGDVLLDKLGRLEKLTALLAAELAFVLVLDEAADEPVLLPAWPALQPWSALIKPKSEETSTTHSSRLLPPTVTGSVVDRLRRRSILESTPCDQMSELTSGGTRSKGKSASRFRRRSGRSRHTVREL